MATHVDHPAAPTVCAGTRTQSAAATLRQHWPEYLIEGWALGMFMISAGAFSFLLESPTLPVRDWIVDGDVRRMLVGIAMGLTLVGLVYCRWGRRSGAHMNPAFTLTFWTLGKVNNTDAVGYVAAQFIGGTLGVLLTVAVLGSPFAEPPLNYVATLPGPDGVATAFIAEIAITFVLMSVVLQFIHRPALMPYAGIACAVLVASYITFEAPLSGMSMNPARSFASAAPAGLWHDLWIYFVAPPIGMLAAAFAYQRFSSAPVPCPKYFHATDQRCIHCGYEPPASLNPTRETMQ